MALITASVVRARLPGLTSDDDTELGLIITSADTMLATYLGFPPASALVAPTCTVATYTEYLDGPSMKDPTRLDLRVRPVASITTIHDDTLRAYGADTLVSSGEYFLDGDEGRVFLSETGSHAWSTYRRAIKVVYTAGWADNAAPGDVAYALVLMTRNIWQLRHTPGLPNAAETTYPELVISSDVRQLVSARKLAYRAVS